MAMTTSPVSFAHHLRIVTSLKFLVI